jgi:hypothetical protein
LIMKVDGESKVERPAKRDEAPKRAMVKAGTDSMMTRSFVLVRCIAMRSYMEEV